MTKTKEEDPNWELVRHSYNTVAENVDGVLLIAIQNDLGEDARFFMDMEVEDEETFYVVKGLMIEMMLKMEWGGMDLEIE